MLFRISSQSRYHPAMNCRSDTRSPPDEVAYVRGLRSESTKVLTARMRTLRFRTGCQSRTPCCIMDMEDLDMEAKTQARMLSPLGQHGLAIYEATLKDILEPDHDGEAVQCRSLHSASHEELNDLF